MLTSPVMRCLKEQNSNAEIHYCTKKQFGSLVEHNLYIHKVWLYDDNMWELIALFRKEKFNYIIDLHHNLRTFWIKLNLITTPSYSFNKLNIQKWLYVNFKWNLMPNKHIVDRYIDTLKPLGIVKDAKGLEFYIPENSEIEIHKEFPKIEDNYAVFVIGAKYRTKQLPIEKIVSWCEKIHIPIILVGGIEDESFALEICNVLHNKSIFNGVGKFSLLQSASIIKQSNLVLTNDTGMMHIAAAFQKKIISFWGNTTPALGMYPYHVTDSIIVEVNNLPCRPCSKIGYNECPKGHFNCMKLPNAEDYAISI